MRALLGCYTFVKNTLTIIPDNKSVKLILHNAHSDTLTAAGKQVTDSEERTLVLVLNR